MKRIGSEFLLSIIIVTYKSRDEIRACLDSLPRYLQDKPVEIIVADNCSSDGIGEVMRVEYPETIFLEFTENLGFAKANNLAYERSLGEFVLFLNPDTISNEVVYLHCLQRLQAEADIGVISPKLVMLDGEMDLACRRSIPTVWDGFCRALGLSSLFPGSRLFAGYNLTYLSDYGTYDVGSVNGAFMMCPRRVLLRTGVFDEQFFMYGDDIDLNYRIRKAGYRVVYDGRVQMIHIKGASSSKVPEKMAKEVFTATKQFYLKHFNPHGSKLIEWKYNVLFRAWSVLASVRAWHRGYRKARPL